MRKNMYLACKFALSLLVTVTNHRSNLKLLPYHSHCLQGMFPLMVNASTHEQAMITLPSTLLTLLHRIKNCNFHCRYWTCQLQEQLPPGVDVPTRYAGTQTCKRVTLEVRVHKEDWFRLCEQNQKTGWGTTKLAHHLSTPYALKVELLLCIDARVCCI